MEAAVSNLTSPGDKVLVVTAGKFGERWQALAKAYGCNIDLVYGYSEFCWNSEWNATRNQSGKTRSD